MNSIGSVKGRNVLLLQGPMGCFFRKLDDRIRQIGGRTFRIGFNAGDRLFSHGDNYTPYRGKPEEWEAFIENFLKWNRIEMIFLFGDCRLYQSIAIKVAMRNDVEVFVFEEGYVRPHYITMEKWGVNDYSHLPRKADFYRVLPLKPIPEPRHARQSKAKMILSAIAYYLAANAFHFRYPYYVHHRDMSAAREAFYGVRGMIRKLYYPLVERGMKERLSGELSKKYYFVPLQTYNDFQILQHSDFKSIEKFIITVLESFAEYAPEDTFLVFKHHPVDRGRKRYTEFIREQAALLGVEDRTIVLYDTYLPTCLTHAIATVTVNSTVGLTSIGYGIPTKALGRAIYDIEGLANPGQPLDRFWQEHRAPDRDLYLKFRNYIIENTQLNGSFYGLFPDEMFTQSD